MTLLSWIGRPSSAPLWPLLMLRSTGPHPLVGVPTQFKSDTHVLVCDAMR